MTTPSSHEHPAAPGTQPAVPPPSLASLAFDRALIGLLLGAAVGVFALIVAGVRAVFRTPALLKEAGPEGLVAGLHGLPAALLFMLLYIVAFAVAGALVGILTAPNWVRRVPPLAGFLLGAIVFGVLGAAINLMETGTLPWGTLGAFSALGGTVAAAYHSLIDRFPGMEPDARSN